jgi:Domain of unknown function (DUF3471)/Domain of unknown function (DUF4440)
MRLHRFLFCLALAALSLFAACKNRRSYAATDQVTTLEHFQQLTQARLDANLANNREFYDRLLAPDFQILYSTSIVRNKQQYLDAERFLPESTGHRGAKPTISEFHAHVDGDTAITTYTLVEHTLFGSQVYDLSLVHLDTYTHHNGEWKLLSMAVADVPSWPDPANINPKRYAEYAGTYEIAPGAIVTVTNENGHLFGQLSRQDKSEWFPENETTFFDKNAGASERTVFERGAGGKIVACVFRSHGQKIRATRTK